MAMQPPFPTPSQPASPQPAPARASVLLLLIITVLDVLLAPFYFLMTAFSGHALLTGSAFSLEGLFVLAMGAGSLLGPILAWIIHFAGGRARVVYILALLPVALPLVAMVFTSVMTPFSGTSGLRSTILAK